MFDYTAIQILALFLTYCFFGWIIESTWVSSHSGKFVNRGFLRGPWIPIYGSGAFVMLFVTKPVENNLFLVFIVGMIGATLLELVTGILMEALFKVRYWDYTDSKYNFMGHICLFTSLAWGFLSIFLVGFCHKWVERLILGQSDKVLEIIVSSFVTLFIIDATLSVKAALDIADIIDKMQEAKDDAVYELEKLQKRMDVYVAVATDVKNDLMDDVEERIQKRNERLRIRRSGITDYYKRSMIKGNPKMISKRVSGAVEEIREYLSDRKKK